MSLFDIGLSGLRVSQYAMQLISTNIGHANNPFYSRRDLDIIDTSLGKYGTGVQVGDVRRIVDHIANQQLLKTQFDSAKSQAYFERIALFEEYVDNKDSSVNKFINESLSALEALNATPNSIQSRKNYLNQLQNLVSRVQSTDKRYQSELTDSSKQVDSEINSINQLLQNLADINSKLQVMGTQEQSSSMSLKDERDELLSALASKIDFDLQIAENGEVQIQLSNGSSLLLDSQPVKLIRLQGDDPQEIVLGIDNNGSVSPINKLFKSGSIAGLMDYYETIQESRIELNRISLSIAERLNQQNKLGVDGDGLLGGLLLTDINNNTLQYNRVIAATSNLGTSDMKVAISNTAELKNSDYELRFDSPTHYELIRKSDGVLVQSNNLGALPDTIDVDGFSIEIDSGSFNNGDVYTISPMKNAAKSLELNTSNPIKLALGSPITTSESRDNKGSGKILLDAVVDTDNPAFSTPLQLDPPVRVEFIDSTSYRLVNALDDSIIENNIPYDPLADNQVFPTPGAYDPGYRITLSGQMKADDTFNIEYNSNGLGDNRNGLLLAEQYRSADGRTSFSDMYQQLTLGIATQSQSAKVNYEANIILNEQAQFRRDEHSAVDLEEEMMNLSRYQEYYMANAQILNTVQQTMDTLFSLLRS